MASLLSPRAISFMASMVFLFLSSTLHTPAQALPIAPPTPTAANNKLPLTHIYSPRSSSPSMLSNPSRKQITSDIISRDTSRANFITQALPKSEKLSYSKPVQPRPGIYTVSIGFGTPMFEFSLLLDTGSNLGWIPCADPSQDPQNSTLYFHPAFSSTYLPVPCISHLCTPDLSSSCTATGCAYEVIYSDGSFSNGTLSIDTLTLGPDKIFDYVFGCSYATQGFDEVHGGLLGMGQGSLGFPAQSSSLFNNTFSYCIPLLSSATSGYMVFGPSHGIRIVHTTSLITQPDYPSFYFVRMREISVNSVRIQVNNDHGIILDTRTTFTRLELSTYENLRDVFINQTIHMGGPHPMDVSPVGLLDTCYAVESKYASKFPSMVLYFEGMEDDGVALPYDNVLYEVEDGLLCLAFAGLAASIRSFGIMGGYQQQGFGIVYDIPGSQIGFSPPRMC